jgi:hypothetical protein
MAKNELSPKEKALVGIGAAVAAGCRPCTRTLLRAARAAGACERGIRLAIETGLYAGTSATRAMASWAESTQGPAPELDGTFRAEKEKLTALILAGAGVAANSTELLGRYVSEAEALDCSKGEIADALVAARTVSRTAATKIESAAARMGFSLQGDVCCPDGDEVAGETPPAGGCGCATREPAGGCGCATREPPVSAGCGCGKGTGCS